MSNLNNEEKFNNTYPESDTNGEDIYNEGLFGELNTEGDNYEHDSPGSNNTNPDSANTDSSDANNFNPDDSVPDNSDPENPDSDKSEEPDDKPPHTKDEILNALIILRDVCQAYEECSDCPLRNCAGTCGVLRSSDGMYFNLLRWTLITDTPPEKVFVF